MAAVGLVTNYMNQKSQAANNEKQSKMAAAQAQYSPWTGMKPETPNLKPVDEVGGALTGAAQGALSGAMMQNAQKQNNTPTINNMQSDNSEFMAPKSPQDQFQQDLMGKSKKNLYG